MENVSRCRGCGETRPSDRAGELCPTCLGTDLSVLLGPTGTGVLASLVGTVDHVPHVLLRDVDTDLGTDPGPVMQPNSTEMPEMAARSGRLQLFGEIARGGMGAVLKGRDTDLGRDLAVKVLLDIHRDRPELVRRFVEEAQITGQLQHPGIVPVYELGAFADHRPYLAMKLVKGRTLSAILADRKTSAHDLPRFLGIFEQVAQTVAYAHARGVIHRDLKPSNIMVGSFGEVQVMDWGLAKVLPRGGASDDASAGKVDVHGTVIATDRATDSDLSKAGSVLGTPSYMAPEQARGEIESVDERADVFALGSILCELLTGHPAFTGRNSGEIQRKAARGELAEVFSRIEAAGDPELVALTKACLAPEAEDRPRHAGEVASAIAAYRSGVQDRLRQAEIAGAEEKARAEEAIKRSIVERDRVRLTVALAASVLGLVALGGGGWFWVGQQRAGRQAATDRVVGEALDKATMLIGQANASAVGDLSKWDEAGIASDKARALMNAGEPSATLRSRAYLVWSKIHDGKSQAVLRRDEADRDRKFLDRLERIRLDPREYEKPGEIDGAYATAFRDFGVDVERLDPAQAGRLLAARSEPLEIALFLDDWTLHRRAYLEREEVNTKDPWRRLIAVALATDRDPWRGELRKLIDDGTYEAVRRLAADEPSLAAQPARSLYLLAQVLQLRRDENLDQSTKSSVEILKRAWRLSPDDYLICNELGQLCENKTDKIRFRTAAVTARPTSGWARSSLANAYVDCSSFGVGYFFTIERVGEPVDPSMPRSRFRLRSRDGTFVDCFGPMLPFQTVTHNAEDLAHAVAENKESVRLEPEDGRFRVQYGDSLMLHGDVDAAVAEYREASRINSKDAQLHEHCAQVFYLAGRLDLAIDRMREVVRMGPPGDHTWLFKGVIHQELGEKGLAFAAYREALIHGQANGSILSLALEATGTTEEILGAYRDAARARPKDSGLRHKLGKILDEQGKPIEARAEHEVELDLLREQARTERNDHGVHSNLAATLLAHDRRDEALAEYRAAARLKPDDPDLHHQLGAILASDGKAPEAKAEHEIELNLLRDQSRLQRDDPAIHDRLGSALMALDRRDEALAEYRAMLTFRGVDPSRFNDLAWFLATSPEANKRDGKIAVEFATRASERTEWKNHAYLDTLAAASAESGDFPAAVKWQSRAIELLADEKDKADYRIRLELYEDRKPYRLSK